MRMGETPENWLKEKRWLGEPPGGCLLNHPDVAGPLLERKRDFVARDRETRIATARSSMKVLDWRRRSGGALTVRIHSLSPQAPVALAPRNKIDPLAIRRPRRPALLRP